MKTERYKVEIVDLCITTVYVDVSVETLDPHAAAREEGERLKDVRSDSRRYEWESTEVTRVIAETCWRELVSIPIIDRTPEQTEELRAMAHELQNVRWWGRRPEMPRSHLPTKRWK